MKISDKPTSTQERLRNAGHISREERAMLWLGLELGWVTPDEVEQRIGKKS